jgi:hypothetical protein
VCEQFHALFAQAALQIDDMTLAITPVFHSDEKSPWSDVADTIAPHPLPRAVGMGKVADADRRTKSVKHEAKA